MKTIRREQDRGKSNHGWLQANFTFSFADYYDPNHMGFRCLRVMNNDRIAANMGFGTHPHRDMEIISFILEGKLKHKDSMGQEEVLVPGEIQVMSAGTGVAHSEFNPQSDNETFMYQIWIEPDARGHKPNYSQVSYLDRVEKNSLTLLVDGKGAEGVPRINQDMELYLGNLHEGHQLDYASKRGNVWIQVVEGSAIIDSQTLSTHDGMAITDAKNLKIEANEYTRFLVFDLR